MSNIGSFRDNWRTTNTASEAQPTSKGTIIIEIAELPILLTPYIRHPKPIVERMMDTISILGLESFVTFSR